MASLLDAPVAEPPAPGLPGTSHWQPVNGVGSLRTSSTPAQAAPAPQAAPVPQAAQAQSINDVQPGLLHGSRSAPTDGRRPSEAESNSSTPSLRLKLPHVSNFDTIEEAMEALHAALEVNLHLKQEVETKGNLVQELERKLAICESRYQHVAEKLRDLEQEDHSGREDVEANVLAMDGRMESIVEAGTQRHHFGVWTDAEVQRRRSALLEKGARQGWLIQSRELQLRRTIGAGTFGQSYLGMWRGAQVAVKVTRAPKTAAEAINFLREVECYSCLYHPFVLPFYGACITEDDQCLLVTQFMTGGTLKEWLYGRSGVGGGRIPHRRLSARLLMALQVAQGMAALEGVDPPIVHRDLKPSNVFVDGAGCARIADMNLSVRLHEDTLANLTGETGTYLYMSPEMMRHEMYTNKTDVWSFGVMLVELCNHRLPYSSLYMTPLQVAMGVADRGLVPPFEVAVPNSVRMLAEMCLRQEPYMRPMFIQIVSQLQEILVSVQEAEKANAAASTSLLGRMQDMFGAAGAAAGLSRPSAGPAARKTEEGPAEGLQRPSSRAASTPAGRHSTPGHAAQPHATPPLATPPRPTSKTTPMSALFSGFLSRTRSEA